MKTFTLEQLITEREFNKIVKIFEDDRQNFHKRMLVDVLTLERMERINKKTGQENDPSYIAYVLEHLLTTNGASS